METASVARALELSGPLRDLLPPVDFCCAYGSTLLHARPDGTSMVDYILGVNDPLQWHSENMERNPSHYSSWMARLGPDAVTWLADRVGVGVYFNPFVEWRDKRIKYGVVGMRDLAMDVLGWDRFYLSGRLQKPVHVLVDNSDIRKVNTVNLKMATSASLLLLPEEFTEVKKIVEGSFQPFQLMYRPMLQQYISEGILKISTHGQRKAFKQDCGVSATNELFSSLPWTIQRKMQGRFASDGQEILTRAVASSKDMAATCVRKSLRRQDMYRIERAGSWLQETLETRYSRAF
ncbi:hypothetical protein BRADI_4g16540v3 [Brachypodium distachyon]|uniref:Phosphatidate cytidylyltransferase, mitochondrial n=1 Tax=Brachypodium distachyon TaxID=15368 RepID=A0A2K2CN64_BRADI|nr:hypothetical protein BRADI_4g16540v3 [Brachypodium distachyon]